GVVDEHGAPVRHPGAPTGDVVPGGPVGVGAVDVEEVDRAGDVPEGGVAPLPDVADAVGHPGGGEVGEEGLVVGLALFGEAGVLAGPPLVTAVRVDGDDRRTGGRGGGED